MTSRQESQSGATSLNGYLLSNKNNINLINTWHIQYNLGLFKITFIML